MAHTHEFDCKICGAHIDSQQELDRHTKDRHTAQSAAAANTNKPQQQQAT